MFTKATGRTGLTTDFGARAGAKSGIDADALRPLEVTINGSSGADSIDGTSDHDSDLGHEG